MTTTGPAVHLLDGAAEAAAGVAVIVGVVGAAFAALVVVGFALLARRTRRPPMRAADDIAVRADLALVRLDDEIAASAEELDFAAAQFGEQQTAALSHALSTARARLTAAFGLRQQLADRDDGHGGRGTGPSAAAERDTRTKILLLCETASESLATEREVFDTMRGLERTAAVDLAAVRDSIQRQRERLPAAAETIERMRREYSASAVAPVAGNPAEAERLLTAATHTANSAEGSIDDTGASAVGGVVRAARRDSDAAESLLDRVDAHGESLAAASAGLGRVIEQARSLLAEARPVRDSPPQPENGEEIGAAIAQVDRVLRVSVEQSAADPDGAAAQLSAAIDGLDTALAGARTEQQRQSHAREALAGAMLTARSQLQTTDAYLHARRGAVGAEARARLAEARRLLTLAEAESDPVIALDTARSSATYSRDADALARYDLLR